MKRGLFPIGVVLLGLCTPAPAKSLLHWCAKSLGNLAQALLPHPETFAPDTTHSLPLGTWLSEPEFHLRLRGATQNILDKAKTKFSTHPAAQVNAVTINEKKYPVLRLLGKENDGTVYLVQTPDGKRVAKVFHRSSKNFEKNLRDLERYRALRVPTVEIFERDVERKTALLEYIEGLSVLDIIYNGLDHGLKLEDIQRVEKRFNTFKKEHPSLPAGDLQNIFLDIRSGRFVLIDPW